MLHYRGAAFLAAGVDGYLGLSAPNDAWGMLLKAVFLLKSLVPVAHDVLLLHNCSFYDISRVRWSPVFSRFRQANDRMAGRLLPFIPGGIFSLRYHRSGTFTCSSEGQGKGWSSSTEEKPRAAQGGIEGQPLEGSLWRSFPTGMAEAGATRGAAGRGISRRASIV